MSEDSSRHQRTRRSYLGLIGSGVMAGLAGCQGTSSPDETTASNNTTTPSKTDPSSDFKDVYVELYNQIVGSVVAVRVPQGGLGSGFLYDKRHVVTNYHVVTDANTVEIQYTRGQSVTGQVIGTDRYSDLAVIRVKERPDYAKPLPLHPKEPEIGTRVAAIGSPYGLEGSMTTGIVSGVNRLIPSPNANFKIPNAIQTDAPVNPGNSGGPLINLNSDVLGVVNSGGGDNIAFAISAALVQRVVPAIIKTGEYNHPYLGVSLVDVTPAVAKANDLKRTRGVLVTRVDPNTPASNVLQGSTSTTRLNGFQVPVGGDVILSIGGQKITSPRDLLSYLELHAKTGQSVKLTVLRNGTKQTVTVDIIARESSQ